MNSSISNFDVARVGETHADVRTASSGPGPFIAAATVTVLTILGLFWLITSNFREGFLPPEYGMWVAKQEMVDACKIGSTVVLGDSRMVAGVDPHILGDATNLALGGASPIEMYYMLLKASACPHPPRRVIVSFSPAQFMETIYFWPRTALFGFLNEDQLNEVRAESRRIGDDTLYPTHNVGDVDAELTNWLYAHHFPSYYMSSVIKGRITGRLDIYLHMYNEAWASGGHHLYSTKGRSDEIAEEADFRQFKPLPLLTDYFERLLSLAQAHGMEVDYIAAPWNEATWSALQPGFASQLTAYLERFQRQFPNFKLIVPVTHTDDSNFGDAFHMNASGAAVFSSYVKELLDAQSR